jgi:hypothetical protein
MISLAKHKSFARIEDLLMLKLVNIEERNMLIMQVIKEISNVVDEHKQKRGCSNVALWLGVVCFTL